MEAERFVVLTTLTDQSLANRACSLLESAGIPVMLEHVEIFGDDMRAIGYRLMAPARMSQSAMRLVHAASSALAAAA